MDHRVYYSNSVQEQLLTSNLGLVQLFFYIYAYHIILHFNILVHLLILRDMYVLCI